MNMYSCSIKNKGASLDFYFHPAWNNEWKNYLTGQYCAG
jgi:hypothetical protein